jgi:pimeloyl-ACP methyl ester carboxylesterase
MSLVRNLALAFLFSSAVACGSTTADPPAPPPPEPIAWGSCPDRFRDQCATIEVPLDHANPSGKKISVFVSRRGTGSKQLWLLQGGPGGSAESFYGLHDFLTKVDPELEVYTIEHRGVGDSTRLGCSAEKKSTPGGYQITEAEWPACRDEVRATWGDDLRFFSTTQAANDLSVAIARTRRPGQKVFVYGGSYGTFWANRFAVLHPKDVDGVILDAPVAPGTALTDYDLQFEPIGRKIFAELCPQAPKCAQHLGADPVAFLDRTFADLKTGQCSSLGVSIDTWKVVFGIFLMDYNLRNWLPALVWRLDRCDPSDQAAIAHLFDALFGSGAGGLPRTSKVLQVHVLLSELWPRTHADDAPIVAARDKAIFFQDALAPTFAMQDTWPRYAVDPVATAYAPPTVPVLTMAGSLDPAAPPALVGYGYRDNLKGPHQTFVEIPYGAHTVLNGSGSVGPDQPSCPVQLARAFFADPSAKLPVECATKVLKPSLDAPAELATKYWGIPDIWE